MNNFGKYVSAQEAKEWGDAHGDQHSLKYWQRRAARKARRCINCDELEWKYAGTDMCFSCTTGEADASEDSELA